VRGRDCLPASPSRHARISADHWTTMKEKVHLQVFSDLRPLLPNQTLERRTGVLGGLVFPLARSFLKFKIVWVRAPISNFNLRVS